MKIKTLSNIIQILSFSIFLFICLLFNLLRLSTYGKGNHLFLKLKLINFGKNNSIFVKVLKVLLLLKPTTPIPLISNSSSAIPFSSQLITMQFFSNV